MLCERCKGCGKVWGDGDNEVPLDTMTALPFRCVALSLALDPPKQCPDCNGTGKIGEDDATT